MIVVWAILKESRVLQVILLALACWGIWQGNNALQRQKGAAAVTAKIEEKANDNAQTAIDVRESVATGKRGKPDPYLRRLQ